MPKTLTIRQAAELLGISRSTAYKLAREDQFPVPILKIGGRIIVPANPLCEALHIDPSDVLQRPHSVEEDFQAVADTHA